MAGFGIEGALLAADDAHDVVWEFVPLDEYHVPCDWQPDALRKRWPAFARVLQPRRDDVCRPVRAEADLRALPGVRLEHLVPAIDWSGAARALDRALAAQPAQRAPIRFVVGQPHGGHARILQAWAKARGARLLDPPDSRDLLAGERHWLGGLARSTTPWVLPELERCFLRRCGGLDVVRGFLDAVLGGAAGEGVVGCDSWAWAFLQRLWPVPAPPPLTLQFFDGRRLSSFLMRPCANGNVAALEFRDARSGARLLPVPDASEPGAVLQQLAAHCRGNPGIARIYWRERLRSEPDRKLEDGGDPPVAEPGGAGNRVVWVTAAFDDPVMPIETGEELLFVVHALLVHNGLSLGLLQEVLPALASRMLAYLLHLESLGIVEAEGDIWQVSALGYASAREALRSRAYLVDEF